MDTGIRFWSQEAKQVEVRYWDSQFLERSTSSDLLENFIKSLVGLDLSKIIQTSINIGSCRLHTTHGSFKTGIEVTDWNIKATAKGDFQILRDSPARRADYISVSGSNILPLMVEDKKVAERLLEI